MENTQKSNPGNMPGQNNNEQGRGNMNSDLNKDRSTVNEQAQNKIVNNDDERKREGYNSDNEMNRQKNEQGNEKVYDDEDTDDSDETMKKIPTMDTK